ncbi:DUF2535 family protein [Bacillus sp. HNG]|uniref:DUF2535 family protein n=1 Tax=Bacillus sp. HNG TaxID=2293325 RepID=UPI000E2ED960|nr:DUF2535 family protein [Bacillus sp. HNG]RFB16866.1 DUF2535 family protein [Bacillus sp. HNG]
MLFKSLEFKNCYGQKVKVIEIPVLEKGNTYHFMLDFRLQVFLSKIMTKSSPNQIYSFREYLKTVLKWTDYERIFQLDMLKHNA